MKRSRTHWLTGNAAVVGLALLLVVLTGCREARLYQAAKKGDGPKVKRLLVAGANPNCRHARTLDTPLIEAARQGHLEVAELLLQHGANVNLQGEAWYAPLHCAAAGGHEAMVRLLLRKGADITLFKGHDTPLHSAVSAGQIDVVKVLLEHGADPQAKGIDEATPLELAAGRGQVELVKLFLSVGVDVNAQGLYGRTALHVAAWNDHLEVGRLLLEHGANPALQCNGQPVSGKSDRFRQLLQAHRPNP